MNALLRRLLVSLLAGLTIWLALQTWRDFTDDGARLSVLLAVGAGSVSLIGWSVRLLPRAHWVAPIAQVLAVAWQVVYAATGHLWLSGTTLSTTWQSLLAGADVAQRQPTPVPSIYPEFTVLVLALGLLVVILGDLIAIGLGRPLLLGAPLLFVITVAAAVFIEPRSAPLILSATTAWVLLVLLGHRTSPALGQPHSWSAVARPARPPAVAVARLLAVAAVLAGVLPMLVPATGRAVGDDGGGSANSGTRLVNPVLNLKRDLTLGDDIDLVTVRTDADPTYLRLSVLDEFSNAAWRPSDRGATHTVALATDLPSAEGLTSRVETRPTTWSVRVSKQFETTWLPLPYPTTQMTEVPGTWRVQPAALDVTSADGRSSAGYGYRLNALDVRPSKLQLANAPFLTGAMVERMTQLPDGMPPLFGQTAKKVTRGSKTDFERAVKLQRWFRSKGGFEYSTATAAGTGVSTLANFISIDRVGYCEQFATAMAVLAREVRIPSRVVVGFLSPEKVGDTYVYSTRDMHAWPELFFGGIGWVRFEPTPGLPAAAPPGYTRGTLRPKAEETPSTSQPSANPSPVVPAPKPVPERTDATGESSATWSWWPLLGTALVGLLMAPWALRSLLRRRRLGFHDPRALAEGIWQELRDDALDARLQWQPGRSPRRVERELVGASAVSDPHARAALHEVIGFVERQRYDVPRPLSQQDRDQVLADLETWASVLRELSPRSRWLPPSMLRQSLLSSWWRS